ncbi:MAG: SAM-dependent methyltransferase [Pseudomonadota bacterium]
MADDTSRFMAMKGAGYYSQATKGARNVIMAATPVVEAALATQALADDGAPVTMTDMGAADGGTSIEMWTQILTGLRAALPQRALQLVYTDLPRNDFGQLFRIVHGQTDLAAVAPEVDNVYLMASATSFHHPIVPPGTLHLGFSATASHYVSETPAEIPDHVHMVGASGEVRSAYMAQGARDWEAFLTARAAELAPGGRLVLYNFGIDEQGRFLGHTGGVSMFDTFAQLWQALATEGVISQEEFAATNFPQAYRTVEEFAAPFEDETSPVYRAGLRLEDIGTLHTRCPFEEAFAQGGMSARDFAKSYIPTLRSWSEPTFVSGLSPTRKPEEIAAIIDRFYQSYEDLVAENPDGHAMDYIHCRVVARKEN